jgi:hypothetical protein
MGKFMSANHHADAVAILNVNILHRLSPPLAFSQRNRRTYRQDYTSVATFAQQLLAKYPIANRTQYTNMYTDT